MHDYSTIFFAVCQDRNGLLFRFVNFAQTQVIFYSRLTSRDIPFCFICAVAFNRDHCKESCAPSRNSSPSQKTVKNCCPIYKKAAEDTFPTGSSSAFFSIMYLTAMHRSQPLFQHIVQLIQIKRFGDMLVHTGVLCQLHVLGKGICVMAMMGTFPRLPVSARIAAVAS